MASGANNPLRNQATTASTTSNALIDYNPPSYSNPTPWDIVLLGVNRVPNPGLARVHAWKRAHEWDIKKGKGAQGGTITYVGRPPAKGTITYQLWTAAHFFQWEQYRALFLYDPTKQTFQAVAIDHPSLADIGVKSVVVENISNIVHEGDGLFSLEVDFIEYFPPPKANATATPTGSPTKGPAPAPAAPSPLDPLQDKIKGLFATWGSTPV